MKTQENKAVEFAELMTIKDRVERRIPYTITSDIEYHAKQLLSALSKFEKAAQAEDLNEQQIQIMANYYKLKGELSAIEEQD